MLDVFLASSNWQFIFTIGKHIGPESFRVSPSAREVLPCRSKEEGANCLLGDIPTCLITVGAPSPFLFTFVSTSTSAPNGSMSLFMEIYIFDLSLYFGSPLLPTGTLHTSSRPLFPFLLWIFSLAVYWTLLLEFLLPNPFARPFDVDMRLSWWSS